MPREYDFAGWVTKNDIVCSDGVIIKQNAFKDDHEQKVPLVWNHQSNDPTQILGHVILHNQDKGIYGYGYFNDTENAKAAKSSLEHGDYNGMSIHARKIKREGPNVVHGRIYEVSLVLAGANPGAVIDHIVRHSDDDTEEAVIYNGLLIHASDDIITHAEKTESEGSTSNMEKTVGDVLKTFNEEQTSVLDFMIDAAVEAAMDDTEDENIKQSDYKEGDDTVKHNIFSGTGEQNLVNDQREAVNELLHTAISEEVTSFKDVLKHAEGEYGIRNIEVLFPEATALTRTPEFYKDEATNYQQILSAIHKSPFQKVKTWWADLTEEDARARGYIKGNQKLDQIFEIVQRETSPQTIYKRQKLDRDDIIDVEDFDVVAYIQSEMRMMLEEEIARAVLVGDGRQVSSPDKIREDKIRPIIKEHDLFTVKKTITSDEDFFEDVINAMVEYRGSGSPTMYIDPFIVGRLKLLKGTDGRYLTGQPMTEAAIANLIGVKNIVPTTFMLGKGALIVNLKDYTIGAAKGGQITNFDDFDIDFNQYKYLIETRLSGALTKLKSAIWLEETASTSPTRVQFTPPIVDKFNPGGKGLLNDPLAPVEEEDEGTGGEG